MVPGNIFNINADASGNSSGDKIGVTANKFQNFWKDVTSGNAWKRIKKEVKEATTVDVKTNVSPGISMYIFAAGVLLAIWLIFKKRK